MVVAGESPDFDSSYFLDRSFWDALSLTHPEGIVVGVPKRSGLISAPDERTTCAQLVFHLPLANIA
jgi:hypothetical protein